MIFYFVLSCNCNQKEQSYRVKHSKNKFAKDTNHINGIENFFASFRLTTV
ncbi:hypothetical protein [Campylobacter troglodytis]|nr:hypothetical protein [Campylobacter troglodytis]